MLSQATSLKKCLRDSISINQTEMKITGLQSCLNALRFDESRIETILETAGSKILADTKSGIGQVDSTVSSSYNMFVTKNENGWTVNVGSDLKFAAFLEFGTGDFVVDADSDIGLTNSYMMEYFVNGKGTLRSHAQLMPAFKIERVRLVEAIKSELNRQF